MAWTYVQAPRDGTVWLEWISPRRENRFASDGYAWGDPEQTGRQERNGYTIEWMTHTVGYRPGVENNSMASHARTRFHFINKNPNVNAPHPDPTLWIVHYHQTDRNRMLPANQMPVSQHARQQLNERRYLESQGQLDKREFMLHDREHWPAISLPGSAGQHMQHPHAMQQHGMYGNPAMMHAQQMGAAAGVPRFPQQPYAQGQPPAKRPRHSSGSAARPGEHALDMSIEDEENQVLDYFDHLTPRDISLARYKQHHYWMEEVFNSPYASSAIVPPDLGLGLMGELKGLTEGILNPPSTEDYKPAPPEDPRNGSTRTIKEAQAFTNLKREQVEEFNKRVEKHLEDGRAEIERMKKEHAEKIAGWKQSKALLQAEKKLRYATWEGHENAVPVVFRLDVPTANGHAEENGAKSETVEDIVRESKALLGGEIQSHKEAALIRRGGLEEEEEKKPEPTPQPEMDVQEDPMGASTVAAFPGQDDLKPQAPLSDVQAQVPQQQQPDEPNPNANADSFAMDDIQGDSGLVDMDGMDMMDDSLIDMDGDNGDITFIDRDDDETFGEEPTAVDAPALPDPQPAEQVEAPAPAEPSEITAAPESEIPAAVVDAPAPEPAELVTRAEESAIPAATADASLGNEPDVSAVTEQTTAPPVAEEDTTEPPLGNDADIFGDGTFDDLPDMGGDVDDDGDGLIDFGEGMDETGFGDAMHGMDDAGVGGDLQADVPEAQAQTGGEGAAEPEAEAAQQVQEGS